eukprot:gb/GEZN01000622.1/.p1 GENE.gb/GEZN01000622.1/~~gb/GEZN01000622.1/.p1  ORF type:complete len:1263 (+),score=239.97 gb/GEZN01000622.1/:42-3791(+)
MFCWKKKEVEESKRLIKIDQSVWVAQIDENHRDIEHTDNSITTSKYTLYNFLPLNLWAQVRRPSNTYFLFVGALQMWPAVSISQGVPTILAPLIFVLLASAFKDALEDYARHQADRRENEREYWKVNPELPREAPFERILSEQLKVGDIVKVRDGEYFPADLMLLHSGDGSHCYLETANLDGETNLKLRSVPDKLRNQFHVTELTFELQCDPPSGKLDVWGGLLKYNDGEALLNLDNFIHRGSKLRNSGYVYGLVVYTGEQTKIRMNSSEDRRQIKRSRLEKYTNQQMKGTVALQVLCCIISGIGAGLWEASYHNHDWYLGLAENPTVQGLLRFWTWFIIFAYLVPISLLVSMEMVKFWQGVFISWDQQLTYIVPETGEKQFAAAQTSGLNEELGYVQYVLCDKTGTLTSNRMDFRKCVIGSKQYGTGETDISAAAKQRGSVINSGFEQTQEAGEEEQAPHVQFNGRAKLIADMAAGGEQAQQIQDFFFALSLVNTIFPQPRQNRPLDPLFKASSPDERALVEFAKFMGFVLSVRDSERIIVQVSAEMKVAAHEESPNIKRKSKIPLPMLVGGIQPWHWKQLALFDFTSKRKRMTVVMQAPAGEVYIFSKGADSLLEPLLVGYDEKDENAISAAQPAWPFILERMSDFGEQGLRTLLIAGAIVPNHWWFGEWQQKYETGRRQYLIEGKSEEGHLRGACKADCRRCLLEEQVEKAAGLRALGATAIEDKLQPYVPSTIKAMLEAGMSVWILTGDKKETAVNIGMACNLLESSMARKGNLFVVDGVTNDEVKQQLTACIAHLRYLEFSTHKSSTGLVLSSQAYAKISADLDSKTSNQDLLKRFLYVAKRCKSVIGCRMQPNQKGEIVSLIKKTQRAVVMAVGDGANDEQMIRRAHVGVGVRGVEGTAAVRASDYAISRFYFLRRLIFVHGRLNYRRVAVLICYIFYKNALLCFVQWWYGMYSGFSGQPLFNTWAYQAYNIIFTGVPILVFATLDRDIDMDTLQRVPALYARTSKGELFNVVVFWQWIFLAMWQSFIVFFLPVLAYDTPAQDPSGHSYGLFSVGVVVYTALNLVVTLKLALCMRSWTWLHHLVVWGSILAFFITMLVLNATPVFSNAGSDYTGMVSKLLATPKFWVTTTVTVLMALFGDFFMFALQLMGVHSLVPPRLIAWLIHKFPISEPPAEQYILSADALPAARRLPINQYRASGIEAGPLPPESARGPRNTGFDFDYTPLAKNNRDANAIEEGDEGEH